jgi:hypothetical protein
MGEFTLGDPIMFQKGSHDRKLVRGNLEMGGATAKGLVETIPGLAEERRKAFAIRRIDRDEVWGLNWFDSAHN